MSKLTALEQFKLGLAKQQIALKSKIDTENKKNELKTPKTELKTPKTEMKTPKTKMKSAKVKTKPVKKTNENYRGNQNNYIDGRYSNTTKSEYMKEWRKKNQDKCQSYRDTYNNKPGRKAVAKAYEQGRPNKEARLEANKLRARERMKNPIYAEKEKLRFKLRRKSLSDADRVATQIKYDKAKFKWEQYKNKKGKRCLTGK